MACWADYAILDRLTGAQSFTHSPWVSARIIGAGAGLVLVKLSLPERLSEWEKRYARQATPCFQRNYGTKRRSADVDSVQMILSATTERAGAFGGAIEEVASWYIESARLQA
jgi:hypothetical protein